MRGYACKKYIKISSKYIKNLFFKKYFYYYYFFKQFTVDTDSLLSFLKIKITMWKSNKKALKIMYTIKKKLHTTQSAYE